MAALKAASPTMPLRTPIEVIPIWIVELFFDVASSTIIAAYSAELLPLLAGDFIYSKYRLVMLAIAACAVAALWFLLRPAGDAKNPIALANRAGFACAQMDTLASSLWAEKYFVRTIPAVLAYNLFGKWVAACEADLEGFAHDLRQMAVDATTAAPEEAEG